MRKSTDLVGIMRGPLASGFHALTDSISGKKPQYTMEGLLEESKFTWLKHHLGSLFGSRYPYPGYQSNNGIFKIPAAAASPVEISLLSDWASGTTEAAEVAALAAGADYSIHLGDTYYVGNAPEIDYNFSRANGIWPYGKLGSFAMLGNHEMYSGGHSYFKGLLKAMGFYDAAANVIQQQEAAYFCLENDHWRIIGLDTGYDSISGLSPNPDMDLEPGQVAWLKNVVKPGSDNRGIVILSHHQCFSAFEDEFPNPLKTIASLLPPGRDVIWLWGHEHWFSMYGSNPMANGGKIYARCIGNSGMPVELKKQGNRKGPKANSPADARNRKLVLYDTRRRMPDIGGYEVGHNGFVSLALDGYQLRLIYKDDNNFNGGARPILEEKWQVNTANGALTGTYIRDLTAMPAPLMLFSARTNDAQI